MKKIILILMLTVLSGCAGRVDGWQLNMANKKCQESGGVDYISTFFDVRAVCFNGKAVEIGFIK